VVKNLPKPIPSLKPLETQLKELIEKGKLIFGQKFPQRLALVSLGVWKLTWVSSKTLGIVGFLGANKLQGKPMGG